MAAVEAWVSVERRWRLAVSSQVKRSLFGPVDHEANRRFLQEEAQKQNEESKKKWDFDFVNDVPVISSGEEQKYQWTPVRTPNDDAPPEMREMKDTVPKNGEGSELSSADETHKSALKQTHITDYMRKRKSSSEHKNGFTASPEPSNKSVRRSSA